LFENNHSDGYGGAINSSPPTSFNIGNLTVDSCVFNGNAALQGGAIYAGAKTSTIYNSLFVNNIAGEGADIYTGQSANVRMIGCTFAGGDDIGFDSGIFCESGQLEITDSVLHNLTPVKSFHCVVVLIILTLDIQSSTYLLSTPYCSVVFNRTTIENNTSTDGGCLVTTRRSLSFEECTIRQNSLQLTNFEKRAYISNSFVEDSYISGFGTLHVTNSTLVNSNIVTNAFESQELMLISSSLRATGRLSVISSQLIDTQLTWYGLKGVISNTVVNNPSIVVYYGTLSMFNTQLYPTQVTTYVNWIENE